MANPSYADVQNQWRGRGGPLPDVFAPFISGKNSDGTPWSHPARFSVWTARAAPAANVAASAVQPAPGVGQALYITGFSLTAIGTIAAAVTATLADGATTIVSHYIPTSGVGTVHVAFPYPIKIADNTAATLTLPALGVSGTGIAELHGYTL